MGKGENSGHYVVSRYLIICEICQIILKIIEKSILSVTYTLSRETIHTHPELFSYFARSQTQT